MSSVVLKNFHKNQELQLINREHEINRKSIEDLLSDKKKNADRKRNMSSKSGVLSEIDILTETDSEDETSNEHTLGKTDQEKIEAQAKKFVKLDDTEIIEQMRRQMQD